MTEIHPHLMQRLSKQLDGDGASALALTLAAARASQLNWDQLFAAGVRRTNDNIVASQAASTQKGRGNAFEVFAKVLAPIALLGVIYSGVLGLAPESMVMKDIFANPVALLLGFIDQGLRILAGPLLVVYAIFNLASIALRALSAGKIPACASEGLLYVPDRVIYHPDVVVANDGSSSIQIFQTVPHIEGKKFSFYRRRIVDIPISEQDPASAVEQTQNVLAAVAMLQQQADEEYNAQLKAQALLTIEEREQFLQDAIDAVSARQEKELTDKAVKREQALVNQGVNEVLTEHVQNWKQEQARETVLTDSVKTEPVARTLTNEQ